MICVPSVSAGEAMRPTGTPSSLAVLICTILRNLSPSGMAATLLIARTLSRAWIASSFVSFVWLRNVIVACRFGAEMMDRLVRREYHSRSALIGAAWNSKSMIAGSAGGMCGGGGDGGAGGGGGVTAAA